MMPEVNPTELLYRKNWPVSRWLNWAPRDWRTGAARKSPANSGRYGGAVCPSNVTAQHERGNSNDTRFGRWRLLRAPRAPCG